MNASLDPVATGAVIPPEAGVEPDPFALLARLEAIPFVLDESPLVLERGLAEEQGWTLGYARAVVAEYRRFLVLTQVAGQPVSPSHDVDEAWHLHLSRTTDYERVCREAFGRFLHHEPAGPAHAEVERHRDMYRDTLRTYRRVFGRAAPASIWPR